MIISNVGDAKEFEYLEKRFAIVSEDHRAVVRITLLEQNVAIKASHFRDGENTDSAERAGLDRQNLTLRDVASEIAVRVTLQTVEGDIGCGKVCFQRAAREVRRRTSRFQQTVLDELIFDCTVFAELAGGSVAAVKAHEGIGKAVIEFSLDFCVKQACGDGVVDVQQRHGILRNTRADVL